MQKQKNILLISLFGLLLTMLSVSPAYSQNLAWHSFDKALAMADTTSRHVLVDVSAPWCGWCRKMKKEVYPALDGILSDQFILTRLNRDDNSTMHRYQGNRLTSIRLAQHFNVQEVPAVVLLSPKGAYLTHIGGFIEPDTLKPLLQYIASNAYRHQSFEQFKTAQQKL
ncbi:thioredoxin family protein [Fodinibius salsisoli]|uniref:Thioredoxin fold domain-containing protein n=1 Tax=Fodinibius salsisoli TaxID=2820877 RepID=A0ABT3PNZ1_9BACT|nr:thioredoxin fold domain-containing protein [Fodinibius salsisoli]MCW9707556.1 thioredoxin fold domain-containing protein [Fodinibius salsisoli]